MHSYTGNSAKGKARTHYGDVHGNTTYNNGDVHGNTIYQLTFNPRPDDSDDVLDKALILPPTTVRPIDARFAGDEQAITVWLKKNNLEVSKSRRTEDVQSLIDRISKYSVYRTYQRLAGRKLSGTTRWILERPEFKHWLESTMSAELFLVGKVGSGKTTLMTTLIENVLEVSYPESPVLSFFFEDPASAAVDLFASLTQQLLRHMIAARRPVSEKIQLAMQQLFNEEVIRPTLEEIQRELFEPILRHFQSCVIIIDGIDSTSLSPIALYLRKLQTTSSPNRRDPKLERELNILEGRPASPPPAECKLKILISTRDDLDLPVDAPKIILAGDGHGSSHNDDDIRKYVDEKLEDQASPGNLLEDESLRNLVRHELLRNAKGMILWVVMQIQYLFGRNADGGICQTAMDVHNHIMEMPPSLNGIYENCLRRQPGPQRTFTARILRWVCASPEPVHVDNMRELLAFDLGTRMLSQSAMPSKSIVLRAATNLVVLESTDLATGTQATPRDYLLPMHSTVRDFLFSADGQSVVNELTGNIAKWTQSDTVLELGGICAAYLLSFSGREAVRNRDVVSHVPSIPTLNKIYDTSLSPGLARVAKQTVGWLYNAPEKHSAQMRRLLPPPVEVVEERLLNFARRNWHLCLRHAKKSSQQYRDFKALVLEHAGNPHHPWAQQDKKSSKKSQLEALLFWAISNDHAPLLDLAIEANAHEKLLPTSFWAEPLAACGGLPLLHFTVKRCSDGVVTLLLPLCSGESSYDRCSALHCAAESASLDVILLLLHYAKGRLSPYRSLLEKDMNGRIPLHLAVICNNVDACHALCDATKNYVRREATGIRIWPATDETDLLDRDMRTPLYYALLNGSRGMVETIMDAGMIHKQDVKSEGTLTSIQNVASRNSVAYVVRRLIKEHEELIRPYERDLKPFIAEYGPVEEPSGDPEASETPPTSKKRLESRAWSHKSELRDDRTSDPAAASSPLRIDSANHAPLHRDRDDDWFACDVEFF